MTHPDYRAAALAVLFLALFSAGRPALADSVYKCSGRDGGIAFQDRPCGAAARQATIEIAPAPPPSASPDYGRRSPAPHERAARHGGSRLRAIDREPLSYECRAADGEVFYRHGACPRSIRGSGGGNAGSRAKSGASGASIAVTGEALPRGEACRRMASARAGRERDETVSTYERNLGRDPCRYF